ncbi:surfactant protein Bb isoform X2 [Periophthalmus magnuspinnatus]|uniref:surfactant protein Bb isoform X2 n=1 Tax=Periophthalmus magnuspinnatus TaxID=409849 RepID=UPI0024363DD9|nr:surfactant protein Bb isoform X2 [Periophthalmus magnuspinnatus]
MAYLWLTAALLTVLLCPGSSRMVPNPLTALKPKHLSTDMCSECSSLLLLSTNMISSSSTKKSCGLLGLCPDTKEAPGYTESRSEKERFSPVCTLCVMVVKKLETLLPKNMTAEAIRSLLSDVCSLMPKSYQEKCEDFVHKYGDDIVEFLLSSAAPHTICTLLHLCLLNDMPAPQASLPSDCDSCRTLSVLSRVHLGLDQDLNRTEAQSLAFLGSVCGLHPHAIPKCEAFTRVYTSQLLRVLGHNPDNSDSCEIADLCVPRKQAPLLGQRRCTWGPSYWCRDMQTAQECGNQVFCKKFVWK